LLVAAVSLLVAAILFPFAVVTGFFVLEVLVGLPREPRAPAAVAGTPRPLTVILVPAHDEAQIIGPTLSLLRKLTDKTISVLVVADNCSDATAERARNAGVEVIERHEPKLKGKGHALAFAARHLAARAPDVVIVLDADCTTDSASLKLLIGTVAAFRRPCQAVNLLRADRTRSAMLQLSTFGFMLRNAIRQRGLQRLAGRVHLTGTGMAIPFPLFQPARLACATVVEDLELGLQLADDGHPARLVSGATVWSSGSTEEGTLIQRRRWEGGFLATSLRRAPHTVLRGLRRGDLRAVLGGLDLMVPPLALLVLLDGAALVAASILAFFLGEGWWPVAVQLLLLAAAGLAVFAAWSREGRDFISIGVLLRLPLYILWKLPLYLRLVRRGAPSDWLRTGR
jgi:cellulose synthase/poly-beta-1,6-N-acetylglucosamine synthase-like glycosyltransferase